MWVEDSANFASTSYIDSFSQLIVETDQEQIRRNDQNTDRSHLIASNEL